MSFTLQIEEQVNYQPTLIFPFRDNNLFICLADGTYIIYNSEFDSVTYQNNKVAFVGLELRHNQCLFGLQDGNGMLIRIDVNEIEVIRQQWRQESAFTTKSQAVTSMGFINSTHIAALSEDGIINIIDSKTLHISRIISLGLTIMSATINQDIIALAQQSYLICLDAQDLINLQQLNSNTIKLISQSQLSLDGRTVSEMGDDPYWNSMCEIKGNIHYIVNSTTILYLITDQGYFYVCEILRDVNTTTKHQQQADQLQLALNINSILINILKSFQFDHHVPLSLQLITPNRIHIAFEGSQLHIYDCQTNQISTILNLRDDRILTSSRIYRNGQHQYIVMTYQFTKSKLEQKVTMNKHQHGKLKIIKCDL